MKAIDKMRALMHRSLCFQSFITFHLNKIIALESGTDECSMGWERRLALSCSHLQIANGFLS